jgi:hypothetical protein
VTYDLLIRAALATLVCLGLLVLTFWATRKKPAPTADPTAAVTTTTSKPNATATTRSATQPKPGLRFTKMADGRTVIGDAGAVPELFRKETPAPQVTDDQVAKILDGLRKQHDPLGVTKVEPPKKRAPEPFTPAEETTLHRFVDAMPSKEWQGVLDEAAATKPVETEAEKRIREEQVKIDEAKKTIRKEQGKS